MLYRAGSSLPHRCHPLTKLAALAAVLAMLPLWPAPVLWTALALVLAAGFAFGFGPALAGRVLALMLPTGLALVLIQGMLIARGPALHLWGLTFYPEGLAHAGLVFVRLALLLAAGLIVVMTTRPDSLARALDQAGLPPSLSYLLTAPLAIVTEIGLEARQIRDSLRLRGLVETGPRGRLRFLLAMTTPLIRNLIVDAPARAELLEMRGFRALPLRSVLDPLPLPRRELWLQRGFVLLAVLQLGALLRWA